MDHNHHSHKSQKPRKTCGVIFLAIGLTATVLCVPVILNGNSTLSLLNEMFGLTVYPDKPQALKLYWLSHYAYFGFAQGLLSILAGLFLINPGRFSKTFHQALKIRFISDFQRIISLRGLSLLSALVFFIGISLRLYYYLMDRSLHIDPSLLANALIATPIGHILEPFENGQMAPLGFLVISKLLGMFFDYRELALTILPLCFGILTLPVIYLLGLELFDKKHAIIFLALTAFSSAAVQYSTIFKQYSGDLFFASAIFFLTIKLTKDFEKKYFFYWAAFGALAVWFSHGSVIVMTGCGAGLIITHLIRNGKRCNGRIFLKLISINLIWLFSLLLNFLLYTKNTIHQNKFDLFTAGYPPWPIDGLEDIYWYLENLLGIFSFPLGFSKFIFIFPFIFFIIGMIDTFRKRLSLGVVFLSPFVVLFALSMAEKYPFMAGGSVYHSRLILFILPIFFFIIVQGIHFLSKFFDSKFLFALLLIFLLNHQILQLSLPNYPRMETRPLVNYYLENRSENDIIYLHRAVQPFKYYTRHSAQPYEKFDFTHDSLGDLSESFFSNPKGGSIWFLIIQLTESERKDLMTHLWHRNRMTASVEAPGAFLYRFDGR